MALEDIVDEVLEYGGPTGALRDVLTQVRGGEGPSDKRNCVFWRIGWK